MKTNSCTPINPKNIHATAKHKSIKGIWQRKKIPTARKFPIPPPTPPITFVMVRPQLPFLPKIKSSNIFRNLPGWLLKQGNQQFQITNDNKTNEKYQFYKVILPDRDTNPKETRKLKTSQSLWTQTSVDPFLLT